MKINIITRAFVQNTLPSSNKKFTVIDPNSSPIFRHGRSSMEGTDYVFTLTTDVLSLSIDDSEIRNYAIFDEFLLDYIKGLLNEIDYLKDQVNLFKGLCRIKQENITNNEEDKIVVKTNRFELLET